MIESSLRTFLLAQAGVAAIVGTRVYPMVMPQGAAVPCIVYQRVNDNPVHDCGGRGTIGNFLIQLDAYADTFKGARDLGEAVRVCLDCYRGTAGTHSIAAVRQGGGRDFYEDDTQRYRFSVDYSIWAEEG